MRARRLESIWLGSKPPLFGEHGVWQIRMVQGSHSFFGMLLILISLRQTSLQSFSAKTNHLDDMSPLKVKLSKTQGDRIKATIHTRPNLLKASEAHQYIPSRVLHLILSKSAISTTTSLPTSPPLPSTPTPAADQAHTTNSLAQPPPPTIPPPAPPRQPRPP